MTIPIESQARGLLQACYERSWTVATAESLTGGGVCQALTAVPDASRVVRGAIVAYHTDLKGSLLDVDAERLAEYGPVDQVVAEQMALGVRERLAADVGIATTGVAGPGENEGHPAGTVHVAVSAPSGSVHVQLELLGDRGQVREATIAHALDLALQLVGSSSR